MKTKGFKANFYAALLKRIQFLIVFFFPLILSAQPDYNFQNAVLVSGTDKQVGASYKFSNVKKGIDALVTITQITNGIILTTFDGGGGYAEAFQPVLDVPAYKNGFVEFHIVFVAGGTAIPIIQPMIAATPIDVDGLIVGGLGVYEYDQIKMSPTQLLDFNMAGSQLTLTNDLIWATGRNNGGVDFPSIDTSAQKVMFTVFDVAISHFYLRVGADNTTGSLQTRLRSVYFKKFYYPNSPLLSVSPLESFTGVRKNMDINLEWKVNSTGLESVILEKSVNSNQFSSVPEMMDHGSTSQHFTDYSVTESNVFYRLKMTSQSGKVLYSNILTFRGKEEKISGLRIYPTIVKSDVTVQFTSDSYQEAFFQVVDFTGKIFRRQPITMQKGTNNITITSLGGLPKGIYSASIVMTDNIISKQIIVQ